MRIYKKIAVLAIAAALVLASLLPATPALAAQKTGTEKSVKGTYLSTYHYVYGTDLKINGKAYNKLSSAMKKKVLAKRNETDKRGFSYVKSAYTSAGSPSYKYITTYGYSIFFKKAGTYTLKYKTYETVRPAEREFYYADKDETIQVVDENGEPEKDENGDPVHPDYYYLWTYNSSTYTWTTDPNVKYYLKTDANGYEYYTNSYDTAGTKIFAQNREWYSWVPATLNDDVLTFKPLDYKVITHTETVIVKNTDVIISSVKLGTASVTYSDQEFEGGYSYTRTVKPFLSGKSGKVVVTPAKGYKVMDIVIMTYDKDGNPVYKLVKNKKKVTFGKYKYHYSYDYKSEYSDYSYGYNRTDMYKTTRVYVFYKDTATGGYTDITKIKKNSDGQYVFTYNYREDSKHPVQKKQQSIGFPRGFYSSYTFYKN